MIALALLVLMLLAVLVIASSSSRHRAGRQATASDAPAEVRGAGLRRWIEAGIITEEQADAITAYEAAIPQGGPRPRISPALEALAYVGGVLVTVGAGMLVSQFWDQLGSGGRLAVLGVAAVLTGVVGAVVGETDPVTWRLRGFLWALSSAGIAAVAGLFAYEVLDVSGEPVALAAAGLGAISSGTYWSLKERPLQHLLAFVGLATSIGVGIAWISPGDAGLATGLTLWVLGATWAWLAWRGWVPPALIGFLAGAVLTLLSSSIAGSELEWLAPVLGLATATCWVALGVARDELLSLGPGLLGVFVFLPWTMGYFFGETVGAPVIAMVSGAALLVIVVVLFRRGQGRGTGAGSTRGPHFHRVAPGSPAP
jgi:hypothetical protein